MDLQNIITKYSFLKIRFWELLAFAGVFPAIATVLGFIGRFSWFLDLFSHFRVQYAVSLTLVGILLLFLKHFKTAIVFILFASVNLIFILPLYFGGQQSIENGNKPILSLIMLNVNNHHGDPERVKELIREIDPDIFVLEEISMQWVLKLACLADTHPYTCLQPRTDNFGIGIYSKLPFSESRIVYIGNEGLPSISASVNIGKEDLRILATHPLPPVNAECYRSRNYQLNKLADYVDSSVPFVLLGDLNTTPWNYFFRRLLKRTGLIDSSKGHGVQTTWPSFNPIMRIPLDHFLHSPAILVHSRKVGMDVNSDHLPVIIDFSIK